MTTSETSDDATAAAASNAGNNESTSDNVTAVDNTKEVTVADVDTAATNVNSNTEVDTTAATTAAADSADALAAALESQLHIGEDKRTNETRESASSGTAASSSTEHDNEVELETPPPPETLVQIAQWIDEAQDILVLTGAGVSVAAGIPDFRTPGTGLYDNLQKYNLPYAEAVFDIDYYPRHPQPFVQLAAELWPNPSDASSPKPTLTHCFVALLAKKGKLLRNYSQNIDGLEHMAGIPNDRLIECHGHFRTARCIVCKKEASMDHVQQSIVELQQPPVCTICNHKRNYIKPDIVFFGEQLPPIFHATLPNDVKRADVCLVLGTSLQVPPTAHIPDMVSSGSRRILLNRELVGSFQVPVVPGQKASSQQKSSPNKKMQGNRNRLDHEDAFHAGDCDDSIVWIARLLGWEEELHAHYQQTRSSRTGKTSSKPVRS